LASKAKNSEKARVARGGGESSRGSRAPSSASRILRIIGGSHRGRKLRFPDGVDIRPTPDRVRETLFNWLMQRMPGARVLDLFAGSGALGIESLSRGATHATFVEQDRRAATAIRELASEWQLAGSEIHAVSALNYLAQHSATSGVFDVVFLDPPYDSTLVADAARLLDDRQLLAPDARIYIEVRARDPFPVLPESWRALREGRAGEVGYHLFAS
jgi:16S rRNA (guanine966-N2)-methyltransferase